MRSFERNYSGTTKGQFQEVALIKTCTHLFNIFFLFMNLFSYLSIGMIK